MTEQGIPLPHLPDRGPSGPWLEAEGTRWAEPAVTEAGEAAASADRAGWHAGAEPEAG